LTGVSIKSSISLANRYSLVSEIHQHYIIKLFGMLENYVIEGCFYLVLLSNLFY